jgi:flavin reductase (DIM6/NTAB) family NADH-FMN oxidoreductase RutF
MTIDPQNISIPKMHAYLLGAVTPRPIALASTIDKDGHVNLSPFSFFNCFGTNPPILIFAPSRRGRDNTTKHTHENVLEVAEVVIHIVSYSMVQQMSLSSAEYPRGVDEFIKAGFTPIPSTVVKPPRVSEAPVAFECKVTQVVPTGEHGGAGILLICEILLMHIQDEMLDADGLIDPFRLDVIGRLGSDWYCRVQDDSIFRVPKPLSRLGIGFDRIPDKIRRSRVLTGNDLGQLASVVELPEGTVTLDSQAREALKVAAAKGEDAIHSLAKGFIEAGRIEDAWRILLA